MRLHVEDHLHEARKQAASLLLRAERPVTVPLASIAVAAAALFAAAVVAGFAMRAHDIESVDRGVPLEDLRARQETRMQLRWNASERPMATRLVGAREMHQR